MTLTWIQGSTSARSLESPAQGTPAPVLLHTMSCPSRGDEREDREVKA